MDDAQRMRRAIGQAGGAAGTALGIEHGVGNAAEPGRKAQGAGFAAFAAGAADDVLAGQAVFADGKIQ